MAFLKSLIDKILPNSNKDVDAATDHYLQLERLRIDHDWINVNVTKNDAVYQSLVLEIDIENQELLIDDLYPPENLDQLEAGDTLEIVSQSKHKPLSFYTRILARETQDGAACWRLELPAEVGRNHSRGAYRVYVESEQDLTIELYHDHQPLQQVHIINLSAEGIKLSFADELKELLDGQQQFSQSIIRLPTGFDVDCDIHLLNLYSIRTPMPHILGGGKIVIENPQQRVKLQQYLASVQRKKRRREMRRL